MREKTNHDYVCSNPLVRKSCHGFARVTPKYKRIRIHRSSIWQRLLWIALVGIPLGCDPSYEREPAPGVGAESKPLTENGGNWAANDDTDTATGTDDLVWTEQHKLLAPKNKNLESFAVKMDIDGDTIAASAFVSTGDSERSGSIHVLQRSDGNWTLERVIRLSGETPDDLFGIGVSISGDTIAAVMRTRIDKDTIGGVVIYEREKGTWPEKQRLFAGSEEDEGGFGASLALDGDTLAVSAANYGSDATGSIYVFVRTGDAFVLEQILKASDGQPRDYYGFRLSLREDTLIVGAQRATGASLQSGAAYVYHRSGGTWQEQAKLVASDGEYYDGFGADVDLSGNAALVGAPRSDVNGQREGAVYYYTRSGDTWTFQQKLNASNGKAIDYFGDSIALEKNTAYVGAPFSKGFREDTGSAYVFTLSDGRWTERQWLLPSDGMESDYFGTSVAMSGNTALIRSSGHEHPPSGAGAVYVFEPSPPQEPGGYCYQEIQCAGGFCEDGVCCESECGGNNHLDCQVCSVAAGSSEDGVCGPLDGTICDDGDPETFDDFCNQGTCEGSIVEPYRDTSNDTDSGSDTDTSSDTDSETSDGGMADGGGESGCECAFGQQKRRGLFVSLALLGNLIQD